MEVSAMKTLGLFFLAFCLPFSFAATPSPETAPAEAAAGSWLMEVDQGQYDQSWKDSAQFFREHVSSTDWQKAVSGVRAPFGKLLNRQKISSKPATSLPGAPDGKYVVIQFKTSFQNKKDAVETVTPMLDKDGKWRVSGYYVR